MQPFHFDNGRTIVVHLEDRTLTFNREENEDLFLQVRELYKVEDYEAIANLTLSPEAINTRYGDSDLSITPEGVVSINGEDLPASLSKVIIGLYKEDAPIDCFINFWNKLQENPSNKAINRIYDFIDRHNITILPDGNMLLYRVVKRTEEPGVFIDIYTKSIKQAVGDTVTKPRNQCDDRDEVSCSRGLHVCSFSYTNYYGDAHSGQDTVVNVSVNPANVVAIPYDYNCAKLRVCEFTILEENTELTEIRQTYYSNLTPESYNYEDEEDYYDSEEDDDYYDKED